MTSEDEWVSGKVSLRIGGVPLDLEMTVPAKPIKPHRMLPIFHQMANSFGNIGVDAAAAEGASISCKAGCGACCRQPVPISEIEVYQIAELVEELPEPRRTEVKDRFRKAHEHFRDLGWFESIKIRRSNSTAVPTIAELNRAEDLVHEYFLQGIACPFLENESCSIHPVRPVACREYLVTSPASNCGPLSAEGIRMVDLPVKTSDTLRLIAQSEAMKREGLLLLISALELAEKHAESFPESTGEQWMADFFGKLTSSASDAGSSKNTVVGRNRKKRKRNK